MSELERLRKRVEELEAEAENLGYDLRCLESEYDTLEEELTELREAESIFNKNPFIDGKPSIRDEMKIDFISANWDAITLENLEAIVSNPMPSL